VEAIAEGDVKRAKKAAEHHMEMSEKTLLKAVDANKKNEKTKRARKAAK